MIRIVIIIYYNLFIFAQLFATLALDVRCGRARRDVGVGSLADGHFENKRAYHTCNRASVRATDDKYYKILELRL